MFIRTKRLFLRPPWPEDAAELYAAINDWDVVRMLSRAPWPYTLADAEQFVRREPDPGGAGFVVFARTEGTPTLVGTIGFGRWRGADREPEIGYWFARAYWGRGFATEAGRAVLELAFEGLRLPRLHASHAVDNPRSGAVLRKLGFEPTGTVAPIPCSARGRQMDAVEYRLTREMWREGVPSVTRALEAAC